jgi:hypothetical protein
MIGNVISFKKYLFTINLVTLCSSTLEIIQCTINFPIYNRGSIKTGINK